MCVVWYVCMMCVVCVCVLYALFAAAGGGGTMKKEPSRDLCTHREAGRHLAACQAAQRCCGLYEAPEWEKQGEFNANP